MPGIAGIITTPSEQETVNALDLMLGCMKHEPFYGSGTLVQKKLNVVVGWVCHQGSFSDCMPVWNGRKDVCLIFSGEHFGEESGVASDLIQLYEEHGQKFFSKLNGWFSGLMFDLRNETVTLFNDRYGLSRIYYHESKDGFHFASEAKSLLAVFPDLRELDQRGLGEYFSVGCVLQNRTLFKNISILPGGAMWTFHRDGRVEKKRYFSPETWEQQEKLTPAAYAEKLQYIFSRVAHRYLEGTQQIGVSLTGGLDSRMILAWVKTEAGKLPCYTFGSPYRDCADVKIARQLAGVCQQTHTTLPIQEDFFREFPALAEKTIYLTDGTMDVTGAVELYVNRLAREIAPVRLTGNYGSEILRANVAFRPGKLDLSLFTPEFGERIKEAADTYRSEASGNRLSFIAFKQVPWHHYSRLALEQSQLTLRSPFLDNELVALAFQTPPELVASPMPLLQLIADGNAALDLVRTDRALRRGSNPPLSKLANQWQEFTVKAEYAYDYGMPHWLARLDQALKPLHLERLFLGRHKFYHFRVWYRDRLSAHVRACGADVGRIPGCYRPEAAKRIVNNHLSGRSNHTSELHKLLSVQLLEQLFIRAQ